MKVQYQKINAEVTPESLATKNQHKIISETTPQTKLKRRYAIVIVDVYGSLTLDNENMMIHYSDKETLIETEQPYDKLKAFIDQYKADVEDEDLALLPFVSGFLCLFSFDLV